MISKQEIIRQMNNFRQNAQGSYYLPIPSTIVSLSTVEEAYLQIGRNASDCKCYYDDIAYREDLYDVLTSSGLTHDDAYSIMQRVRKGLAEKVDFEYYHISQRLKDWCRGVRYLPSREIITTALAERVSKIADNEAAFREALLDTLPEYKYTPMTFISSNDALFDISKSVYALGNSKGFHVEEEVEFQIRDYDVEYKPVKIIAITKHNQSFLPPRNVIYTGLEDMISSGVAIVALIESSCYAELEERTKALLHRGVVCDI